MVDLLRCLVSRQGMDEWSSGDSLSPGQSHIAIVRDRFFRIVTFPAGVAWLFVTKGVDPACSAWGIGRVPPRADLRKHFSDGVFQRIVPQRGAMLILKGARPK